jgi:ADP-ribosylglycohydrolase
MTTRLDQIRGCLLGGAVGDALGADIEFMWLNEIRNEYGPEGVMDYTAGQHGAFTDDTQLTLFTAEGLLDSVADGGDELGSIHRAYLRWYATQGQRSLVKLLAPHSGLITVPGMHRRRAPGNTCLSALKATKRLGGFAVNDSKGCGGIMRSAPIGLFAPQLGDDDGAIFGLAVTAAGLTHGHPSGQLPAGVLAVMIAALLRGKGIGGALLNATDQLRHYDNFHETMQAVEAAIVLAGNGCPSPEQLENAFDGGGWTGESALGISLACALTANSFEQGVLMAVNHSGDSDSTGAITGNLLGALFGVNGIPAHWLKQLELRHTVDGIAVKLDTATTAKAIVE